MSRFPVPAPNRRHLERLSLGGVIAQHARGAVPDPAHGTCTDDVARSIEVDLAQAGTLGWPVVSRSIRRSMRYLEEAFDPERRRFRNQRSADGRWLDDGSDDAFGRAIAALGAMSLGAGRAQDRARADTLLARAFAGVEGVESLRAIASLIIGLGRASAPNSLRSLRLLHRRLLDTLMARFEPVMGTDWPWPEPTVTYASGLLAEGLIRGGVRDDDPDVTRRGLEVLAWLAAATTRPDGRMSFVGNDGWWTPGHRARFDQQPIEAISMLLAAEAAYDATGDRRYATLMEGCYGWFLGGNDLRVAVGDPATGAGFDALTPTGVNRNQGAESTLAWLLAVERIRRLRSSAVVPTIHRPDAAGSVPGRPSRSP